MATEQDNGEFRRPGFRYRRQVASLALLGDERAGWRPNEFGYELWGCRAGLMFPVEKLLDYRARWLMLEESRNPFATVVMAHLKAQETRQDALERRTWKLSLVRRLYERGYGREDVLNLFRFIDWVLQLPEELDEGFWREVCQLEEVRSMPYVTSVERIGIKKGIEQGLQQGLLSEAREAVIDILETRFGEVPGDLAAAIQRVEDVSLLKRLHKQAVAVRSMQEFAQAVSTFNVQR